MQLDRLVQFVSDQRSTCRAMYSFFFIFLACVIFRPKKIAVFPLTCRKKLGSVGRKIFLFFYKFLFNKIRSKMVLWATFH